MISGKICLKPLRVSTAVIVEFPASLSTQIFIHLHMVTTKPIKDGCQECSAVKAIIEGP